MGEVGHTPPEQPHGSSMQPSTLPYLHTARAASHPVAAPRYAFPHKNAGLLPRVAEEAWHSSSVLYFEQEVVQDNHYLSTSKVARRVMSKSCTRGGKREGRMGRTDRTTERTRGFTTLHHRHLKQSSFSTCPITSHRTPLLC